MEKTPNLEDVNVLKERVIEVLKNKSTEAEELYSQWSRMREDEIDSEIYPKERKLQQIRLNIERGDIYAQIGMISKPGPNGAQYQIRMLTRAGNHYRDALQQLSHEKIVVPERSPEKIDETTINELRLEVKNKNKALSDYDAANDLLGQLNDWPRQSS